MEKSTKDKTQTSGNGSNDSADVVLPSLAELTDEELEALSDEEFLAGQGQLLQAEKSLLLEQAASLKLEAERLAQEAEPGEVQFDEESGEGGTTTVDRERNLALASQARAGVDEVDEALRRMAGGHYGVCANCHMPIPRARLRALPYARLCVKCKAGGLSALR